MSNPAGLPCRRPSQHMLELVGVPRDWLLINRDFTY